MATPLSRTFAVRRLICIDSFKPGAAIEIKLEGHTNINGDNGAGKTTLLRLIPPFFGVAPGDVVRKAGSNQSFVEHYLPRTTSYIIYEYRRGDQLCQAVICRPSAREAQAQFRFINDPFQEGDYKTAEGEIIPSGELSRNLTKAGVDHSRLLSQKQYRRVIQFNKAIQGNDNPQLQRELNQLSGKYAFCETNSDIAELDRVVGSILEREPSFDAIKDVLCAVIDSEESASGYLEPSLSRKQVEEWVRDSRAYKTCVGKAPRVESLQLEARKLEGLDAKQSTLHGIAGALNTSLADKSRNLGMQLARVGEEWNSTDSQFKSEEKAFNTLYNALESELEAKAHQKTELEKQRDEYSQQDVEQKRQAYIRVPAMDKRIAELERQLSDLKSGAQSTEQAYEKLMAGERDSARQRIDDRRSTENTARKEKDVRESVIHEDFSARRHSCDAEFIPLTERLEQAKETTSEAYQQAKAELKTISADPELLRLKDSKQAELNKSSQAKAPCLEAIHAADASIQAHCKERDRLTCEHERLIQEKVRFEDQINELKKVIDADADTLLGFLRSEHPAWTDHIAKLVPESVLMRSDLKPSYRPGPQSDSLYGIQLDLSAIDTPSIASIQQLQTDLGSLEMRCTTKDEGISRSEDEIRKFQRQRPELDKTKRKAQQAYDELDGKIADKNGEIQSVVLRIEQEVEQRRITLSARAKSAHATFESDKSELDACNQRHRDAIKSLEGEEKDAISACKDKLNGELDRLDHEITQIQQALEQQLEQLDQQRLDDLKEKGLDTRAIAGSERAKKTVEHQREAANSDYELVKDYDHWEKTHWSRHAPLLKRIKEIELELKAIKGRWDRERTKLEVKLGQLSSQRSELGRQQNQLGDEIRILGNLLLQMKDTPVPDPLPEIDVSHSVSLLQAQWSESISASQSVIVRGQRIYTEIANTFTSLQGEPARLWQLMRDDVDPNVTERRIWHAAAEGIASIFENELPVLQDNLLQHAKIAGHTMTEFYDHLKDLDSAIRRKGRQMSEQINGGMRFEAIDKLEVRLHSTITEIDFWPVLKRFKDQYRQWESQGFSELPDADMTDLFNRVTELLAKGGHRTLKDLFTLDLTVVERGREKRATSDKQLENISSTGLSYLILILILVGLVNLLRQRTNCAVLWPVDELGNFTKHNSTLLLSLLQESNIFIVSAFPDPDPVLLKLYKHAYYVDDERTILQFKSHTRSLSDQVLEKIMATGASDDGSAGGLENEGLVEVIEVDSDES